MIYFIIILRVLFILGIFGLFVWLMTIILKNNKKKPISSESPEEIELYINRLKESIKKAEIRYNSGIESAKADIENYKQQLERLTELKKQKIYGL